MATPGVLLAGHPTAGDAPIKRSASLDANPQPVTAPAAPRKTGASESLINAALASSIDPEFETSALALAILGLIGLIARRGAQR